MSLLRQQFANQLKLKGRSDNTIRNYIGSVAAISQHFNTSPLLLKKEQIESYQFFQIQEKKLSTATVNLCTEALKAFFKIMDPQQVECFLSISDELSTMDGSPVLISIVFTLFAMPIISGNWFLSRSITNRRGPQA
jgi:hypothetical protein